MQDSVMDTFLEVLAHESLPTSRAAVNYPTAYQPPLLTIQNPEQNQVHCGETLEVYLAFLHITHVSGGDLHRGHTTPLWSVNDNSCTTENLGRYCFLHTHHNFIIMVKGTLPHRTPLIRNAPS